MKKIALFAVGALMGLSAFAQSNDPVLMHINGNPITRSEFEYSFNKNNADGVLDKKDVKDYVQLFVDFKLKVEAAKDAGIDTISAIRKELFGYKEQMVIPTLVDSDFIEREARNTYEQTAQHFQVRICSQHHIFLFCFVRMQMKLLRRLQKHVSTLSIKC